LQIWSVQYEVFGDFICNAESDIYFDNVINSRTVTVRADDGSLVDVDVCRDSVSVDNDVTTPVLVRLMSADDADVELMDSDMDNLSDDSEFEEECYTDGSERDSEGQSDDEACEGAGDCTGERKKPCVVSVALDCGGARDAMESG
jgi:hypothetical protein